MAKQDHARELLEVVGEKSLVEVVLHYWLGRWVEGNERQILEEMMVLVVDHRAEAPSAAETIRLAEKGKGLLRSVEAGVGKIDDSHGGAVEGCMKVLLSEGFDPEEIVASALKEGKRLPGFGHRVYTDEDPRASYLFKRLVELEFDEEMVARAKAIEVELELRKGKRLVINIDGAMAVVLATLGVKPELANGFFLWPRVAGLVYRFLDARR